MPSVKEHLKHTEYHPELLAHTLFIGLAMDELPVLLDLQDPAPGALLITDEHDSARSLKAHIAQAAEEVGTEAVFYVVNDSLLFEQISGSTGVCQIPIPSETLGDSGLLEGLKQLSQPAVLFINGLTREQLINHNVRDLLLKGPANGVWPIITADTQMCDMMREFDLNTTIITNTAPDQFTLHQGESSVQFEAFT